MCVHENDVCEERVHYGCEAYASLAVVLGRNTVSTLPYDSSTKQSDHANDGKDDVRFRPDHS